MRFLAIQHLAPEHLPDAVELDRLCFGGIWAIEGYRRELESPNSDLLGLWTWETEDSSETPWEEGERGGGEGERGRKEGEKRGGEERRRGGEARVESYESAQNLAATGTPPLQVPRTLIGIGCLWAILEEAHIIMLAIHPQFQRQGLGQALLLGLLKSACDRQLERSTLEVRDSNLAAVSLYKKFGFKEAGRRKRYYEDTGEDALVMWRSGLEKPEFQQYLAVEEREMRDRLYQKKWHWAIDSFEF